MKNRRIMSRRLFFLCQIVFEVVLELSVYSLFFIGQAHWSIVSFASVFFLLLLFFFAMSRNAWESVA